MPFPGRLGILMCVCTTETKLFTRHLLSLLSAAHSDSLRSVPFCFITDRIDGPDPLSWLRPHWWSEGLILIPVCIVALTTPCKVGRYFHPPFYRWWPCGLQGLSPAQAQRRDMGEECCHRVDCGGEAEGGFWVIRSFTYLYWGPALCRAPCQDLEDTSE